MKLFTPILCLLLASSLFGQSRIEGIQLPKTVTYLVNQAEEAFYEKNYPLAESRFIQLTEKDSSQLPYYQYHIALCRLYSRTQLATVYPILDSLYPHLSEGFLADLYHFHLARAFHEEHQFDQALEMYELGTTFEQATPEFKDMVERYAQMSITAKKLVNNPVPFRVVNVGSQLNTENPEYHPMASRNESKLIFTSRRADDQKPSVAKSGTTYEDIYIAERSPLGNWYNASPISDSINGPYHEASTSLSPDGSILTFYQSSKKGRALMQSHQTGRNWSTPTTIKGIPNEFLGGTVYFSKDEKFAFFSSDMPGGFGGKDLYMIFKKGPDSWSKPINLGNKINTAYDEDAPFLDESTNLLYFASNGHETMGGYDIFKSRREGSNRWSPPVNLGYPINSTGDDTHFKLVANGRRGYFSSSRMATSGGQDIYQVIFKEVYDQDLLVTGKINTNSDEMPDLLLIDEENQVQKIRVSPRGEYMLLLDRNRIYELVVSHGELSSVFEFTTPALDTALFNETLPFGIQQLSLKPIAPYHQTIGESATLSTTFNLPDSLIYLPGKMYADRLNKDYFGTLSLLYAEGGGSNRDRLQALKALRRITDPGMNYLTPLIDKRVMAASSSHLHLSDYPPPPKTVMLEDIPMTLNMGRLYTHRSWEVDQIVDYQQALINQFIYDHAQSIGVNLSLDKTGAFVANVTLEENGLKLPSNTTAQQLGNQGLSSYFSRLLHSVSTGQLASTDSVQLRDWVNLDNIGLNQFRLKEILSTPIEQLDSLDIVKCLLIHAEYIDQKLLKDERELAGASDPIKRITGEIERQIAFITLLELDEQNKRDLYVEKVRGIIEGRMIAMVDDALHAMTTSEVYHMRNEAFLDIVGKQRKAIIHDMLDKPITKWAGLDTATVTQIWRLQEQRVLNHLDEYRLAYLLELGGETLDPSVLVKVSNTGSDAAFKLIRQLTGTELDPVFKNDQETYALLDTTTFYHLQISPQSHENQILSFKTIDSVSHSSQLPFGWILSETLPLQACEIHVGVKQKVAYFPVVIDKELSEGDRRIFDAYYQSLCRSVHALSDSLQKLNSVDQLANSVAKPIESELKNQWLALSTLLDKHLATSQLLSPDSVSKYSRASVTIYPQDQVPTLAKVPTAEGDFEFLPDHYAKDTTSTLDEMLISMNGLLRPIVQDSTQAFDASLWSTYLVDVLTGIMAMPFDMDSLAEFTYRSARKACEVNDTSGLELSPIDSLHSFVKQRLDREKVRQAEILAVREAMELEYLDALRAELITLSLDQSLSFDERSLNEFFSARLWDAKSTVANDLDSSAYLELVDQIQNAWSEQDTLAWKGAVLETNYRLEDGMCFLVISLNSTRPDTRLNLENDGQKVAMRESSENQWLAYVPMASALDLTIFSGSAPAKYVPLPELNEIKEVSPGLIWMNIDLNELGGDGNLGNLVHVSYGVMDEMGEDETMYFNSLIGQLSKSYSSKTFVASLEGGRNLPLSQEEQQIINRLNQPTWEKLPKTRNSLELLALEDQVYLNIESNTPASVDGQYQLQSRILALEKLPPTRMVLGLAEELNVLFELNPDDFKAKMAQEGSNFKYRELKKLNDQLHELYALNPDLVVDIFTELLTSLPVDSTDSTGEQFDLLITHKNEVNEIIDQVMRQYKTTRQSLTEYQPAIDALLDSLWNAQSNLLSLGAITGLSKDAWLAQSFLWVKQHPEVRPSQLSDDQLIIWLKQNYTHRYLAHQQAMLETRGAMLWQQAQQTSTRMIMIESKLKDVWQEDELVNQSMEMQVIDADGNVWPYLMQPDKEGNFLMMLAPDREFKLRVILANDATFEVPIQMPDSFAFKSLPVVRHELSLAPIQVADSVIAMEWHASYEGMDNPQIEKDVKIQMQDWEAHPETFGELPALNNRLPLQRGDSAARLLNKFQGFVSLSQQMTPQKESSSSPTPLKERDYHAVAVALSGLMPIEPSKDLDLADALSELKTFDFDRMAQLYHRIDTTQNWTPGQLQELKEQIAQFDYVALNRIIVTLEETHEFANPALQALADELQSFNYQSLTRVLHQLELMETSDKAEMEYVLQGGQNFEFIELAYVLENIALFEVQDPEIASDLLIDALSTMLAEDLTLLDDSGTAIVVQQYLNAKKSTATPAQQVILNQLIADIVQHSQYTTIRQQSENRAKQICQSVQGLAKDDISIYTASGFDKAWISYQYGVDPDAVSDDLIARWVRKDAFEQYSQDTKAQCHSALLKNAQIEENPSHQLVLISIDGHTLPANEQSFKWDEQTIHWQIIPRDRPQRVKNEIGIGNYQTIHIPSELQLTHVHTTLAPVTFLGDTVAYKAQSNRRSMRAARVSNADLTNLNVLLSIASSQQVSTLQASTLIQELFSQSDITYALGIDSTWQAHYQVMSAKRSKALAELSVKQVETVAPILQNVATALSGDLHEYAGDDEWEDLAIRLQNGNRTTVIEQWKQELQARRNEDQFKQLSKSLLASKATGWVQKVITNSRDSLSVKTRIENMLRDSLSYHGNKNTGPLSQNSLAWMNRNIDEYILAHEQTIYSQVAVSQLMAMAEIKSDPDVLAGVELRETELPDPDPKQFLKPVRVSLLGPIEEEDDWGSDSAVEAPESPVVEDEQFPVMPTQEELAAATIDIPKPEMKVASPVTLVNSKDSLVLYFKFNTTELTAQSAGSVNEWLTQFNATTNYQMVGYTDTAGTTGYNQMLSQERAEVAKALFVSKGVDASQIETIGAGEKHQVANNRRLATRVRNRRVVVRPVR